MRHDARCVCVCFSKQAFEIPLTFCHFHVQSLYEFSFGKKLFELAEKLPTNSVSCSENVTFHAECIFIVKYGAAGERNKMSL